MGIYSLSQRTTSGTNATPAWEIIDGGNKPRIMEIGFSQNAATASVFALGRPAATGLVPTTPVTVLDESDGAAPAGLTTAAVAWGTPPTAPTQFFRRCSTPATLGAGMIWTFPQGLAIPVGKSIVLWNLSTNAICDIWAVIQE